MTGEVLRVPSNLEACNWTEVTTAPYDQSDVFEYALSEWSAASIGQAHVSLKSATMALAIEDLLDNYK